MKKIISFVLVLGIILNSFLIFSFAGSGANKSKEKETQLEFKLDSLPDIGEYETVEIKSYFYEDGPLDEFVTSDEYKFIVPYAYVESSGRFEAVEIDYDDLDYENVKYGLATCDGKIITKPIYEGVNPLGGEYEPDFYDACVPANSKEYPGAYNAYVIKKDGSWSLFTYYNQITYTEEYNGKKYLIVKDENEVEIYDYDGNKLFDIDTKEYFEIMFIDNEYAVLKFPTDKDDYINQYNRKGEKTGSFSTDSSQDITFVNGNIYASFIGIFDFDGKEYLNDNFYDINYDYYTNQYIANYGDGGEKNFITILDDNFTVIRTFDDDFKYSIDSEYGRAFAYNEIDQCFIDLDNKVERRLIADGYEILNIDIFNDDYIYCITEFGAYVYGRNGQMVARLNDAMITDHEFYDTDISFFGDRYLTYRTYKGNFNRLDLKTGKLSKLPKTELANANDYIAFYNENNYFYSISGDFLGSGKTLAFSVDTLKPVTGETCKCIAYGDYFGIYTDTFSEIIDKDGNVVLKILNKVGL